MHPAIVGVVFFVAFFTESVFGFGGLLLSFSILSFFLDLKEMVYLGLYVALSASISAVVTDRKSFSKVKFIEIFKIAVFGVIIGTFMLGYLSSPILLKIFSVLLLIFAIKNIFFDKKNIINKYVKSGFLFLGGLVQGIFGTGAPFTVLAMKDSFKNKGQLRTTMAVFFIVFNILRTAQLSIQGEFSYQIIYDYYWLAIVVIVAIFLGHKVHLKISENVSKFGINGILLFASIALILK